MSPSSHTRVFDEEVLVDYSQFPDRIAETFRGKTVFLTGGTGFVGKALVEKLLHNTDVKKIYILIKSKRGEDTHKRFANYFNGLFFDPLKKERPESLKKVEPIQGDLSQLDLGISREDRRKLIDEVEIIYHSAASVRFDEFIKKMILLNVRGTRNMIALAKEVTKLQLFVHVSTTFCQPRNVVLEEAPGVTPHNPHDMIRMAENMDDASMNVLTAKLVGAYGNTYTFSKALAEGIVFEQLATLPIMVLRPSIVMPCHRDPIPGYTDSEYGPMGLWILCLKGLLHVTNVEMDNVLDYVGLDMVVNALLITTYNYINNTEKKVTVCNATTFKMDMQLAAELQQQTFYEVPLNPGLGYPWCIFIGCPVLYIIALFFTQLLPAIAIDAGFKLAGKKPKRSLLDIQRKIARTNQVLEFYSQCKRWNFKNDTIRTLRMDLNEREDETYPLNIEEVDMCKYSQTVFVMLRKLVLLEKDEDIPRAKLTFQRLKIVHYIIEGLLTLLLLWFSYTTILPLALRFVYYIADV